MGNLQRNSGRNLRCCRRRGRAELLPLPPLRNRGLLRPRFILAARTGTVVLRRGGTDNRRLRMIYFCQHYVAITRFHSSHDTRCAHTTNNLKMFNSRLQHLPPAEHLPPSPRAHRRRRRRRRHLILFGAARILILLSTSCGGRGGAELLPPRHDRT